MTEENTMEIKLITRHNFNDKLREDFDRQYLRFHDLIFKTINLYEEDHGIDAYLSEAKRTPRQVQNELQEILTRHQLMKRDYYNKPALLGTMGRTMLYVNDWLEETDMTKMSTKQKAIWVVEVIAKVGLSYRHFFMNYRDQNNINNTPKRDYEHVWNRIVYKKVRDPEGLKAQLAGVREQVAMIVGSVMCEQSWSSSFTKKLAFGSSLLQYALMGESAKLKSISYFIQPSLEDTQAFLNCAETGVMKYLSKLSHDDIKMKKKIWVPADGKMTEGFNIHDKTGDKLQVRILCHEQLTFKGQDKENQNPNRKQWETIIIHVHGGAFMGGSSRASQGSTRKWANQLKVPMFCIDYRMPPEHTYPGPVYDCYHAYNFIANHIHKFMNVRPKNIYMVGDSAGGNLCCGTTALLLKNKLEPPTGLYLPYPAIDLRRSCTESAKHMMDDVLLWPSMIHLVCKAYLNKDYSLGEQPLASPCLLTEGFVSGVEGDDRFPLKWPKTIMTMGDKDPLKDGTIFMMQKMVEAGIDSQLHLYEGLGHGLVGLGKVIEKGERAGMVPIKHMKKLMNIEERDTKTPAKA